MTKHGLRGDARVIGVRMHVPGLEKLYAVLSMAQKGPKIFARYARMRAVEDMVFARYARVLLCL